MRQIRAAVFRVPIHRSGVQVLDHPEGIAPRSLILALLLFLAFPSVTAASDPRQETSPPDAAALASILGQYVTERDALLLRPEATAARWDDLARKTLTRLDIGSLPLNDLTRAVFAGLFDAPAAEAGGFRATADARLREAAPAGSGIGATPAAGARLAAARLRLLGAATLQPKPATPQERARRVGELLDHPGLAGLLASDDARLPVLALCAVGSSTALRANRAGMARVFNVLATRSDAGAPVASPKLAADLERLGLLALLTAGKDLAEARKWVAVVRDFGKAVEGQPAAVSEAGRAAPRLKLDWIEQLVLPPASEKEDVGRSLLTLAGMESVLKEDSSVYNDFLASMMNTAGAGGAAGGDLSIQFDTHVEHGRTLLRLPDSWYWRPSKTRFEGKGGVLVPAESSGGGVARYFDGVELSDPGLWLAASDLALSNHRGEGFARNVRGRLGGGQLRVGLLTLSEAGGVAAERMSLGIQLGRAELLGIRASSLSLPSLREGGELTLKDVRLRLAGFTLMGRPTYRLRLSGASKETGAAVEDSGSGGETGEEGKSPLLQFLKMPSIGTFKGNLSIAYNNSLKFAGRYTGILAFKTYGSVSPSTYFGLNYNLATLTNETDNFVDAASLQEDSRGSYYFRVLNQAPDEENRKLLDKTLFIGAYSMKNQFYESVDGGDNRVSIPVSFGVNAGGRLFRMGQETVGGRFQAAYEEVNDGQFGDDTRLALTGIVGPPALPLAPGLNLTPRVEGISRIDGSSAPYSWLRGLLGVNAQLIPPLRLSGAYLYTGTAGVPRFPYDEVEPGSSYAARADVTLKAWRLSYSDLYTQKRGWYRTQWFVGREFLASEFYLAYDAKFGSYSFGLNMRLDRLFDVLTRRRFTQAVAGP